MSPSASFASPCVAPPKEQSRWFQEEVQPHEPALRAYLRGRFPTLTDIDDLVQETYARLFRARNSGKIDVARPYLFATARNAAVDLFRKNRIIRMDSLGEIERLSVVEERPDAAEFLSHDQEIALLREAIAALPERCRQVLTLRRFHHLSHREIAQKLGIAEKTVDAQLCIGVFRCREFLRVRGVSRDPKAKPEQGGMNRR